MRRKLILGLVMPTLFFGIRSGATRLRSSDCERSLVFAGYTPRKYATELDVLRSDLLPFTHASVLIHVISSGLSPDGVSPFLPRAVQTAPDRCDAGMYAVATGSSAQLLALAARLTDEYGLSNLGFQVFEGGGPRRQMDFSLEEIAEQLSADVGQSLPAVDLFESTGHVFYPPFMNPNDIDEAAEMLREFMLKCSVPQGT